MKYVMAILTTLALAGCAARQQTAHEAYCAKFENVFPDIKTANACPPPAPEAGGTSTPTVNVFVFRGN
jgi:hypothetical protein